MVSGTALPSLKGWMDLGGSLATAVSFSSGFYPTLASRSAQAQGEGHGVEERPTLLLLHGSHLSLMASNPSLDFTEPRIIPKALDTQEARIPTGLSSIFLSHQSTNPPSGKLGVPGGPREQAHSGLPLQSLTQKVNSTCSRTAWKFRHTLRMTAIVTD